MKAKKQAVRPKPDVKGATRQALSRAALMMENADWYELFGIAAGRRTTPEETAAFTEAKSLAVAYVRKGAEL
jgi:hypothetical protein